MRKKELKGYLERMDSDLNRAFKAIVDEQPNTAAHQITSVQQTIHYLLINLEKHGFEVSF